jgi:Flp pilus assembly secretin CpaC
MILNLLILTSILGVGPDVRLARAGGPIEWDAVKSMGVIRVGLHRAREITTRRNIVRVAVGSEEIADIMLPQTESPRQIRVVGIAPGTTNLIIWYGDNTVDPQALAHGYEIRVDTGYAVEVIDGTQTDEDASLK